MGGPRPASDLCFFPRSQLKHTPSRVGFAGTHHRAAWCWGYQVKTLTPPGPTNRPTTIRTIPHSIWPRTRATISEITRITGTDDKFIPRASGLSWAVIHLTGSGDEFSVTSTIRYPDGQLWHYVSLLQVRDGKVWRESTYFGLPFDAPDWRSEVREAP